MVPTQEQTDFIKHALGVTSGRVKPFRNYYCAEPDDDAMTGMVSSGWMKRGRTIPGGLVAFHVTEQGAAAVGSTLPDPR